MRFALHGHLSPTMMRAVTLSGPVLESSALIRYDTLMVRTSRSMTLYMPMKRRKQKRKIARTKHVPRWVRSVLAKCEIFSLKSEEVNELMNRVESEI